MHSKISFFPRRRKKTQKQTFPQKKRERLRNTAKYATCDVCSQGRRKENKKLEPWFCFRLTRTGRSRVCAESAPTTTAVPACSWRRTSTVSTAANAASPTCTTNPRTSEAENKPWFCLTVSVLPHLRVQQTRGQVKRPK